MELKTILRHISKDKKDYYLIDLYVYYDSGKRYRLSTSFVDKYVYYQLGGSE